MFLLVILLSCASMFTVSSGANILGIYPMASRSHQMVFQALTIELATRGHNITVVTPDPIENNTRSNIRQIDISYAYGTKYETMVETFKGKRGVIFTPDLFDSENYKMITSFMDMVFNDKDFEKIVNDKSEHFDLVIAESLYISPAVFGRLYDAPVIWFSSFYGLPINYNTMGAPYIHPYINPHYYRTRIYDLNLYEKLSEIYLELRLWYIYHEAMKYEQTILEKYFGKDVPSVYELQNDIDLFFVNANPIFEGNRPLPPNVISLGGIHLKPIKTLPEDIKIFLDDSKRGVIYVSLGTNVRPSRMEPEFLHQFLKAFSEMQFDILWRFDLDEVPTIPNNVMVRKWFPQRDLLHHPNIKAFVTQGGLQSTDEAIDAAVPVIGIPILGDQWFNVETYIKLEIGVKVDALTLTASDIVAGVKEVTSNTSYKRNILKLRTLMRDQPQTPLERAVWWTEYVIRHRGAKHLRANSFNMSWTEYLMMDVVALILATFTAICILVSFVVKSIMSFCTPSLKLKST